MVEPWSPTLDSWVVPPVDRSTYAIPAREKLRKKIVEGDHHPLRHVWFGLDLDNECLRGAFAKGMEEEIRDL